MRAMIREGDLIVVDAKGKRRHRAKIPMAMAENFVTPSRLYPCRRTTSHCTSPECVRSPGIDVSPKRTGGLRARRATALLASPAI